ncbi:metalloprotease TldD [Thiorhodospira sibirica]|uniref:metalloprotease TldD n=1 Tax=Thiorhodospira sibirica TaxID=154347 RepID=UPI00022C52C5|nr:metalloprotease TldD [Thiorhodospira sibirica]
MTHPLDFARQCFLEPVGLAEKDLEQTLGSLLGHGIDRGDIYFQLQRSESWSLEDSLVKDASYNIDRGVGIRAISGEKTGFAYTDDISLPALHTATKAARAIAKQGQDRQLQIPRKQNGHHIYAPLDPLESLCEQDKIDLLQKLDSEARRLDPRITQVMVSMAGVHEVIMVANSDGTLAGDIRPLVRLNVHVIAEQGTRREQGSAGGGARTGYGFFIEEDRALGYVREAVRQALLNLEAVDAPAGSMTVVLGPGWPGVLLHEAVGHGLEGDFNRKGTSAFSQRMGQQVAAKGVTVVDDGTLSGRRGSLNIDDEGTLTQRTVLIEDGILRGYMQDRLNAGLMGVAATGNGRRESYAHLPLPRMTNTYMLAGEEPPEDILASVKRGLYAVNFGGGQVDITSGKFVFSASEAYLIEDGKITRPVKGATLIGNGPEVMQRISRIGNDLQLDEGVGTCGKEGQSLPVGVGQPTLRIDGITVGGTQAA